MRDCIVLKDSYPKTRVKLQSAAWLQRTLVSMNSWCVSSNMCHFKRQKIVYKSLKKMTHLDSKKTWKKYWATAPDLKIFGSQFLFHSWVIHNSCTCCSKSQVFTCHTRMHWSWYPRCREKVQDVKVATRGGVGHRESYAVWFLMQTCIFSNQQIIILKKSSKNPLYLHSLRFLVLGIFESNFFHHDQGRSLGV